MNSLRELLVAATKLQASLVQRGWRFCFIGGVAVQRWGNPRFTQDLDLTLLTGFGEEERFKCSRAEVETGMMSKPCSSANAGNSF